MLTLDEPYLYVRMCVCLFESVCHGLALANFDKSLTT